MNPQCGLDSPVRSIECFDDWHVVECQHCREFHVLRHVSTEEGEPIQFEVIGLINA